MINNISNLSDFRKVTYPGISENRYMISTNGQVYDIINKRFVSQYPDKDGYFKIIYTNTLSNKSSSVFVHRLVAWEFYPETRNLKLVVDHIDGNKQNNNYTNLEWVTIKENTNRAEKLGLRNVRGTANGNCKYSEEIIHDICRLMSVGKSNMDIVREFRNVGTNSSSFTNADAAFYKLVVRIRLRQLWPDVTSQYDYPEETVSKKIFVPNSNSIFNEDQVHYICKELSKSTKPSEILSSMGIFPSSIDYKKSLGSLYEIARRKTWTYISCNYEFDSPGAIIKNKYKFDEKIINMINQGYSCIDVYRAFGLQSTKDNVNLAAVIRRKYLKYFKIAQIKNGESIQLESIKGWEAIQ